MAFGDVTLTQDEFAQLKRSHQIMSNLYRLLAKEFSTGAIRQETMQKINDLLHPLPSHRK